MTPIIVQFSPSEMHFKIYFQKTSKKMRKSRILASQTPPKTLPKSAALLAAPGVSKTIAFFLRKPCSDMLRGGPGLSPGRSKSFHVGAMLASFFVLGRFFSLLGVSLPDFVALAVFFGSSWPFFWCLGSLWGRFWTILEGSGEGFGCSKAYFSTFFGICLSKLVFVQNIEKT